MAFIRLEKWQQQNAAKMSSNLLHDTNLHAYIIHLIMQKELQSLRAICNKDFLIYTS